MKNRPKQTEHKVLDHKRFCRACGVVAADGPVGHTWDFHTVRDPMGMPTGDMFGSCSVSCREKLGVTERKTAAVPDEPKKTGISWLDD